MGRIILTGMPCALLVSCGDFVYSMFIVNAWLSETLLAPLQVSELINVSPIVCAGACADCLNIQTQKFDTVFRLNSQE